MATYHGDDAFDVPPWFNLPVHNTPRSRARRDRAKSQRRAASKAARDAARSALLAPTFSNPSVFRPDTAEFGGGGFTTEPTLGRSTPDSTGAFRRTGRRLSSPSRVGTTRTRLSLTSSTNGRRLSRTSHRRRRASSPDGRRPRASTAVSSRVSNALSQTAKLLGDVGLLHDHDLPNKGIDGELSFVLPLPDTAPYVLHPGRPRPRPRTSQTLSATAGPRLEPLHGRGRVFSATAPAPLATPGTTISAGTPGTSFWPGNVFTPGTTTTAGGRPRGFFDGPTLPADGGFDPNEENLAPASALAASAPTLVPSGDCAVVGGDRATATPAAAAYTSPPLSSHSTATGNPCLSPASSEASLITTDDADADTATSTPAGIPTHDRSPADGDATPTTAAAGATTPTPTPTSAAPTPAEAPATPISFELPRPFARNRAIQMQLKELLNKGLFDKLRSRFSDIQRALSCGVATSTAAKTSLAHTKDALTFLTNDGTTPADAAAVARTDSRRRMSSCLGSRAAVIPTSQHRDSDAESSVRRVFARGPTLRQRARQEMKAKRKVMRQPGRRLLVGGLGTLGSVAEDKPMEWLTPPELDRLMQDVRAFIVPAEDAKPAKRRACTCLSWQELLKFVYPSLLSEEAKHKMFTAAELLDDNHLGTSDAYALKAADMMGRGVSKQAACAHIKQEAAAVVSLLMKRHTVRIRAMMTKHWKALVKSSRSEFKAAFDTLRAATLLVRDHRKMIRPFRALRGVWRRRKHMRLLYQYCYRPMRRWRHRAAITAIANRKALILGRVWSTVVQMRSFRKFRDLVRYHASLRGRVSDALFRRRPATMRPAFEGLAALTKLRRCGLARILETSGELSGMDILSTSDVRLGGARLLLLFSAWRLVVSFQVIRRRRARLYYLPSFATSQDRSRLPERYQNRVAYLQSEAAPAYARAKVTALAAPRRTPPPGPCPSFPSIATLGWVKSRQLQILLPASCHGVYADAEAASVRDLMVRRGLFIRLAPRIMLAFKTFVSHRRKKRFVWFKGSRRRMRRLFKAWAYGAKAGLLKDPGAWAVQDMFAIRRTRRERVTAMHEREENLARKELEADLAWDADRTWRRKTDEATIQDHLKAKLSQHQMKTARRLETALRRAAATGFAGMSRLVDEFTKDKAVETVEDAAVLKHHLDLARQDNALVMYQALDRGFDNMELMCSWYHARMFIAALRKQILIKVVNTRFMRAKLKKYIRICKRLQFFDRYMPTFYKLKVKLRTFRKLLKFVNHRIRYATPMLRAQLNRRKDLMLQLGTYLSGMSRTAADERAVTLKGTFLRWAEYTNSTIGHKLFVRLHRQIAALRLRRRAFYCWSTGIKAKYLFSGRLIDVGSIELGADMDVRRELPVAKAEHEDSEAYLRRVLREIDPDAKQQDVGGGAEDPPQQHTSRSSGSGGVTFRSDSYPKLDTCRSKTSFPMTARQLSARSGYSEAPPGPPAGLSLEARRRLSSLAPSGRNVVLHRVTPLEKRLLVDRDTVRRSILMSTRQSHAYWLRRHARILNVSAPDKAADAGPAASQHREPMLSEMLKAHEAEVDLRLTYERRMLFRAFAERQTIPVATRQEDPMGGNSGEAFHDTVLPANSAATFTVYAAEGVFGVQTTWESGTSNTQTVSKLHGHAVGQPHVFRLVRGEVVVAMETRASNMVGSMRLFTNRGRVSKWFGHGQSGKLYQFGDMSRYRLARDTGITDDLDPEYDECLQGFSGRANSSGLVALGTVLRRVLHKNVLGNCWTELEHDFSSETVTTSVQAQFCTLLSLRASRIRSALKRSHQFARFLSSAAARHSRFKSQADLMVDAAEAVAQVEAQRTSTLAALRAKEGLGTGEAGVGGVTPSGRPGSGARPGSAVVPQLSLSSAVSRRPRSRAGGRAEVVGGGVGAWRDDGEDVLGSRPSSSGGGGGGGGVGRRRTAVGRLNTTGAGVGAGPLTGTPTRPGTRKGHGRSRSFFGGAGAGAAGNDVRGDSEPSPRIPVSVYRPPETRCVLREGVSIDVPVVLSSSKMAFAVAKWMFQSLTRSLVQAHDVRTTRVDEGKRILRAGYHLRERGMALMRQSQDLVRGIPGYHKGTFALNPAVLGEKQCRQYEASILESQRMSARGSAIIQRSNKYIVKAHSLIPHIPSTMSTRRYFESLKDTVVTLGGLDAERMAVISSMRSEAQRRQDQSTRLSASEVADVRANIARDKFQRLLTSNVHQMVKSTFVKNKVVGWGI